MSHSVHALFCIVLVFSASESSAFLKNVSYPVVMWHGMGDCCCNPLSLGHFQTIIEKHIPGVYVLSIMIGNNVAEDTENGFLMNVNDQIDQACEKINSDPNLKAGYNAIGMSQGGQFLRALAQRCPFPPMHNLISIGGQHQGVYGLPHCSGESSSICNYIRKLLTYGAYYEFIQNHVVQAEYWHDPLQEEIYKQRSVFLADINQERNYNETYKTNLLKIKNLVLVMFENDTMVEPRETSWFGFYKPGQSKELYTMQESPLYLDDKLGLKTMDQEGRIHFLSVPGDHLQFTEEWFLNVILAKYL